MVPEPNEGSVVDFVMLTDRAEVHDGKLYIMGGAWDRLFLTDFDNPYSISFAIAVSVPYAQTEREQRFEMQLMRNGEQVRGWQLGFRAGRGGALLEGQRQQVSLALTDAIPLPGAGTYVLTASVGGTPPFTTEFYIEHRPIA